MKRALVCGAGGFIGSHLVRRLKQEGYWVRGADQKPPEFSPTDADEFLQLDLREPRAARAALAVSSSPGAFDEVYQLAADMGGMGFIHSAECEIMRNSALININMIDEAARAGVGRYFFSSSVCIYRDMEPGEPELSEEQAYPALPDNEYGWEKLYAERMLSRTAAVMACRSGLRGFRTAMAPKARGCGGREKAPAAICRKVAEAEDGGTIEVWGDGSAIRSYTYVDDMVDGIYRLTQSDLSTPSNIGSPEYVTVDELVRTVAEVAGKQIRVAHVEGQSVCARATSVTSGSTPLGWRARFTLRDGIALTYPWVESQVRLAGARGEARASRRSLIPTPRIASPRPDSRRARARVVRNSNRALPSSARVR